MNEKLILVVDDSKFLCTMLQKAFDSVGYNTLVAYTLEEGLSLFEASRPDLLLLDINLPDRPGPQACREIKANPQYNSTSIILMSGSYEDYIKQQVAESGADGYIRKPFSPGSILSWVRANSALLFNEDTEAPVRKQKLPAKQSTFTVTNNHQQVEKSVTSPVKNGSSETSVAGMLEKAVPSAGFNGQGTRDSLLSDNKMNENSQAPTPDFFGRNLSIIITDDSTFLCAILKDTLEKVGFKVHTFPNIRETGLYLRENKADLLFLDINLPDISGNRACQIIKESPITANLPIVLISGAQEEKLRQLTITSGANGFITKPFTPMTVLTWLKDNSSSIFQSAETFKPDINNSNEVKSTIQTSAVTILIDQLSSPTRAVKLAACYSLGEFKSKEATAPLLSLLSEKDLEIRGEAIWALGEIKSQEAFEAIIKVLEEENVWIKGRAIEALGKLGNPIVINQLATLFNSDNQDLKIIIIKAVGSIGTPEARTLLQRWSRDPDKDVAANANILLNLP
jgi:DNA-binding response OmpR family regulator